MVFLVREDTMDNEVYLPRLIDKQVALELERASGLSA